MKSMLTWRWITLGKKSYDDCSKTWWRELWCFKTWWKSPPLLNSFLIVSCLDIPSQVILFKISTSTRKSFIGEMRREWSDKWDEGSDQTWYSLITVCIESFHRSWFKVLKLFVIFHSLKKYMELLELFSELSPTCNFYFCEQQPRINLCTASSLFVWTWPIRSSGSFTPSIAWKDIFQPMKIALKTQFKSFLMETTVGQDVNAMIDKAFEKITWKVRTPKLV